MFVNFNKERVLLKVLCFMIKLSTYKYFEMVNKNQSIKRWFCTLTTIIFIKQTLKLKEISPKQLAKKKKNLIFSCCYLQTNQTF